MKVFGDMSLGGLAQLAQGETPEGGAANFAARVLDTDGDGRPDLFLLDADNDGTVDGVVRALDVNGDGQNDAYVTYNDDGSIRSIGRVSETGDLEVVYEEPGVFDQLLADLGLIDLPSPEEALFTSFDDPYITDTYGAYGADLPDELPELLVVQPSDVTDMNESDYLELSGGATVVDDTTVAADNSVGANESVGSDESAGGADSTGAEDVSADAPSGEPSGQGTGEAEASESQPGEPIAPKILEVGDKGEGWLYARVDVDGDGVADRTDDLQRTVDGWEADVNQDGSKETVAFDADRDGRVDSVDTSGSGDWAGSTQAWEVVHQPSDLLDDGLYQGDAEAVAVADDSVDAGAADTAADEDTSWTADTSVDTDAGASYDSGGGTDTTSSYDSGGSSDVGSAVDSGGGGVDET